MTFFKFGYVEEIQRYEIQDTRYRNGSRRKGFYISCIFVSCNLYLTEKLQFVNNLPSPLQFIPKSAIIYKIPTKAR